MRLVKFTDEQDQQVFVNPDLVRYVCENDDNSVTLVFDNEAIITLDLRHNIFTVVTQLVGV
jgi:hypothetical protein